MINLELCVASPKGIELANKYSIDRIELCQNLEVGGVTPSMGLVKHAVATGVETHVLIRPRMGGFDYSEEDFQIMERDIHEMELAGVKGVVIGALVDNSKIDIEPLKLLVKTFPKLEFTFHRAFDDVKNWQEGIDQLHQIGFKRVLSSGLAASVDVGLNNFAFLKDYMQGKIELMIGGGVSTKNISRILARVNPDAMHFSATTIQIDPIASKFSVPRLEIDEKRLQDILALLR